MQTDLERARSAKLLPISEVGARLGIPHHSLIPYGHYKAKISTEFTHTLQDLPDGKLILVTAMNPTPAGEGKTTTTIGLGDALCKIGKKAIICLREPSLGPCFGMKGGAAGGGQSQVAPMEDINLHFTGDFHAISAANNLLSALIDNHIYWKNPQDIDSRRITWRRVLDMNDRALRSIVSSLGGASNGYPREDGFDITVASEVMAIFCLATDLSDLERRLGNIIVASRRNNTPVTARDLQAEGAMTVLLKDAFMPNLVQTLENNPAFIHGGPFANIAHGCNSVQATRLALKMGDYVVTEAGFGADLGAEKFFNIKCRKAGLQPAAAVIVATIQALKFHGGIEKDKLSQENVGAVKSGYANLARHIANLRQFGVPSVVALNRFVTDSPAEINALQAMMQDTGTQLIICSHWAEGGAGAVELARHVIALCNQETSSFRLLYEDGLSLWEKAEAIARNIYGASGITANDDLHKQFQKLQDAGYGKFPLCMAKTQYSFSTNPNLRGAPTGHNIPIREIRLSAGAEFIVLITGDVMTMPGLPQKPAANMIGLNSQGAIRGLF